MQSLLYVPILIFSILIFGLFVWIMALTVIQYMNFTLTTGTIVCEKIENSSAVCMLTFDYGKETYKERISFDEIGESGTFTVDVAYHLEDGKVDKKYILGSNKSTFLGTQNNVIIYSVLSFLSLILVISLIPFRRKKSTIKK